MRAANSRATPSPRARLASLPKATPRFVEPMKALLAEKLPRSDHWIYEIKFDGVRALAIRNGARVELVSRAGNTLGPKFPQLVAALQRLDSKAFVLDGEIVALDPEGRSSFQLLQSYGNAGFNKPPLLYYAFDLLNLDGRDTSSLPLEQRKSLGEAFVDRHSEIVRFSSGIDAHSERVLKEMQARGLEGLIAKLKGSIYEPGRRSGSWIKFKWSREQEFVIGGYTEPRGGRSHFGALLVGYYRGRDLLFAGKVGTGFNEKNLAELYRQFQAIRQDACPFINLPEKLLTGRGITAGEMRRCTWLKPRLVAQVRFAEWTRDDHLRQPAFLGLRDDKRPEEVVREAPLASAE
jgi:bifunctional non-homologous end joining protein LigD